MCYRVRRYESYTQEFTFLFEKLENFALANMEDMTHNSCGLDTDADTDTDTDTELEVEVEVEGAECASPTIDTGVKICLEIFYYWVNFAPLSRGSAATGYSVLLGCIASLGEVPVAPLPRGVQIDWLGMLSPSAEEFILAVYPYVAVRTPLEEVLGVCEGEGELEGGVCAVSASTMFRTARDIIYALNLEEEEEEEEEDEEEE